MRMPKPGAIVCIHFVDHNHNSKTGRLTPCRVYGEVFKVTDEAITVDAWAQDYEDPEEADERDPTDNTECFTIARVAITNMRRLTDE